MLECFEHGSHAAGGSRADAQPLTATLQNANQLPALPDGLDKRDCSRHPIMSRSAFSAASTRCARPALSKREVCSS